ncbi:MAG: serine protease [Solirubrobacterales bacterium]|nr:serine protease [Solirubrobacterales bacterium]
MGRRLSVMTAAGMLACALAATPAGAVVGGRDTAPGAYRAVAYVTLGGSFACTGTLIAPAAVLTAGHCGSLTGSFLATPIGWPPASIGVTIGAEAPGGPGEGATVARVAIPPSYLNTTGSDISLLLLNKAATPTPVRIAGRGEEDLWKPTVTETIVGYGTTSEGGDTPKHLQEGNVPVVTDASCATSYSTFDARTMLCAGFPEGGVDSCQGDSGGPLFGHRPDGSLVVVGATSQGDGCARPGKPGVYARVADAALREWIRGVVPGGVDADVTPAPPSATTTGAPAATPSGQTCASTRKVAVHVNRIYRGRLKTVVVLVAGKRVATLRGGRTSAKLSFAGLKKGTVRVQLVMTLKSGKKVTDTRRFKVCGG